MKAYGIEYMIDDRHFSTTIDAKDIKSAKNKIARKHGFKSGNKVKVIRASVIGYF